MIPLMWTWVLKLWAASPSLLRDRIASGVGRLPLPVLRRRAQRQVEARRLLFRQSLPPDPASGREAVRRHALWVADFLSLLGGREIELEVPADLPPRTEPGPLFVTLHVGNWIAAAELLACRYRQLHTVAGTQLHPSLRPLIGRAMDRRGVVLHSGPGTSEALLRALRAGQAVVIHLDGSADPSRVTRGTAPLGVRAAARLAVRSGAPVYFALAHRLEADRCRLEHRRLHLDPDAPWGGAGLPDRALIARWEARLLDLWREEVLLRPAEWLIFRADPRLASPEVSCASR
ncbi:MAG: hypothetical protein IPK72_17190 [Candidatus Eisenbacteria bacterium]|nr:hypothetical protein [Candidatus Eisenbacteria bacterium]